MGNSLSMTFRCANGIRQGGQLSPLLYNVYTDDLNHHLQATCVGCYVGGARVDSLSYADDTGGTCTHGNCSSDTLGGMSRICWTSCMTLHTTQRKQYVCWSGKNNHRVGSQQESGSEMRNLALSRSFVN